MEITTEITELDHNDFQRDYAIKRRWLMRLLILLGLDLILSAFVPLSSLYLVTVVLMCIILTPFFFGIPYLVAQKRIRHLYEQSPSPNGKKTFKPFASGIEITDENGTSFLRHEEIKEIGKTGGYVFIFTKHTGYYLLPLECFFSEYETKHFIRIVNSALALVRGKRSKYPLTFKPIYLVGLLCFIPIFGFIAGLVLLILGIAHFKDRIFIIIGAFGMLFTIALYSSLFYFSMNTDAFRDGFADIAQTQLNDLVKNVEFYKLQNGNYPDSLQQLNTKGSFANIFDPMSMTKIKDREAPFHYSKHGNKYLLFSVGKDGKPNTADDIYPNITIADTSKLGFIRKLE